MIISTVLGKLKTSNGISDNPYNQSVIPTANSTAEKFILADYSPEKGAGITVAQSLTSMAQLIANTIEAYSAVIFLADRTKNMLTVGAYHTLSRDFVKNVLIPFGSGLIGWTAENKNRISVCPFENDSTTLLYYLVDQNLKSFISLPILNEREELLGVLACDSKKTYAFSKIVEKVLHDCAKQTAILIELHQQLSCLQNVTTPSRDSLASFLEDLRELDNEDDLLNQACQIPQDVIRHDALVVLTLSENGAGQNTYYSLSNNRQINHHLMEHVCRNKKMISNDKSVHVGPSRDSYRQSFLSVPFKFLSREAGSFNLLSANGEPFSTPQIKAMEQIAIVVGRELERIRLHDRFFESAGINGINSWKNFKAQGAVALKQLPQKTHSLIRIDFGNMLEVEHKLGIEGSLALIEKTTRLVEQLKRHDALACRVYGTRFFVLTEKSEAASFVARFQKLVEKISLKDLGINESFREKIFGKTPGALLLNGAVVYTAHAPRDGETLDELCSKIDQLALDIKTKKENEKETEVMEDARVWA